MSLYHQRTIILFKLTLSVCTNMQSRQWGYVVSYLVPMHFFEVSGLSSFVIAALSFS